MRLFAFGVTCDTTHNRARRSQVIADDLRYMRTRLYCIQKFKTMDIELNVFHFAKGAHIFPKGFALLCKSLQNTKSEKDRVVSYFETRLRLST